MVNITDTQEKYEYWLDAAKYDLDSAGAMYSGGRWLYVAFMCQQAIEKLCKGLYTLYVGDDVPRVHNISGIIDRFSDKLPAVPTDEQYKFFDRLTAYYLKGRYPEYKQKVSAMLDEQEANALLNETKGVFEWLLTCKP